MSAWSNSHRLLLGLVLVENKSNEIKAIPALLELLDITGCMITLDAMGTQTEIAGQIVAKGADYILSLKANHPTLHAQVKAWFEIAQSQGFEGIEHSYDRRVEARAASKAGVNESSYIQVKLSLNMPIINLI